MYGSFVRAVRQSRGLTQQQLAGISGIRASNVSAIENDRRMPTADTLNRLLVSCGFELAAKAGERTIYCPLPRAGWFPDEDLPPALDGDPEDERPTLSPSASMKERVHAVNADLDAVDATRRR